MSRVVHFEVHASDPQRAIAFYTTLFGWSFQKWPGPWDYWLVGTGPDDQPGINGGLVVRRGDPPLEGQAVNSFVITVDVASVDGVLAQLEAQGGSVAVAKMPVPTIGWLAYIKDPDGNILGILQKDPAAS